MQAKHSFADIATRLSSLLPDDLNSIEKELQDKFQTVLTATFDKFVLITREEFDAQCKVLARTRQKLEALEKKLQELEQ